MVGLFNSSVSIHRFLQKKPTKWAKNNHMPLTLTIQSLKNLPSSESSAGGLCPHISDRMVAEAREEAREDAGSVWATVDQRHFPHGELSGRWRGKTLKGNQWGPSSWALGVVTDAHDNCIFRWKSKPAGQSETSGEAAPPNAVCRLLMESYMVKNKPHTKYWRQSSFTRNNGAFVCLLS